MNDPSALYAAAIERAARVIESMRLRVLDPASGAAIVTGNAVGVS